MPPTHKIATIQLHPVPLQPSKNFAKATSYIRSAAAQGCELVVLPEYHLTNWVPSDPNFVACCDDWEKYLKGYQDLARELKICIVPGTILEKRRAEDVGDLGGTEGGGGKEGEKDGKKAVKDGFVLLNVCYLIGNDGEVIGRYVKKNLWGPEREHLVSSRYDPHEVFDTPVGKVGLLICWDLAFPEAFRELIAHGAEIIVIPTFCKTAYAAVTPNLVAY
jgi:predicted amidohydrolase